MSSVQITEEGHQRLHSTSSNQDTRPTIPELTGGHGPWQLSHWFAFFVAAFCLSVQLFATHPLASSCKCHNPLETVNISVTNRTSCVFTNTIESYWKYSAGIPDCYSEQCTCSSTSLVLFAKLLYAMGILMSSLTVNLIMLKCGRRASSLVNGLLLTGCTLAMGWSPSSATFLALRFLISFAAMNLFMLLAFSLVEFVGADYSRLYALTGHLGWCLARFLLPLTMLFCRNWTQYNITLSTASLLLFLLICCIPESVEIYISKGLWGQAQKIVRKAATSNNLPTENVDLFCDWSTPRQKAIAEKDETKPSATTSKKDLLRKCFHSFFLFLVGFSSSFLYFTSVWLSERLPITYMALVGTTEIASVLILLFFTCFVSYKRLWSVTTILAAVALLIFYARIAGATNLVGSFTYLLTTFFTSASWTLFLNNSVFNSKETVSYIALCFGMMAAAITDIQKFYNWNPKLLVIYSIPNLTLGICTAFLPDRYFQM